MRWKVAGYCKNAPKFPALISEKRIVMVRSFVIDCFMGAHDGFTRFLLGKRALALPYNVHKTVPYRFDSDT